MGLLWLGVAPLVTGIIGRMFGLTHFNTLYGIVFLSHQVGSFVGAWMGGVVFDRTRQLRLRVGRADRDRHRRVHAAVAMDERPPRPRTSAAAAPA